MLGSADIHIFIYMVAPPPMDQPPTLLFGLLGFWTFGLLFHFAVGPLGGGAYIYIYIYIYTPSTRRPVPNTRCPAPTNNEDTIVRQSNIQSLDAFPRWNGQKFPSQKAAKGKA